MAVKCTECGASIQDDSKFCRYCGAKIQPDNTQRIEVKVDDSAEMKRASYEEQESLLRQEKMKRELKKEKRKPYIILAKVLSVLIPLAIGFFVKSDPLPALSFLAIALMMFMIWLYQFLR
jgi:uncharacterized membrane protein YvbJ